MKTFDEYSTENLTEVIEPLTFSAAVLAGSVILRSNLWDKFIDKLEEIANKLEKDHFLNKCLDKLKSIPHHPSVEDIQHALGPDYDRFKKEFTGQVLKVH